MIFCFFILFLFPFASLFVSAVESSIRIHWSLDSEFRRDWELYDNSIVYIDDIVIFDTIGPEAVYIHPAGGCNRTGSSVLWDHPGYRRVLYRFSEEDIGKNVTFACNVEDHCESGQTIQFRVQSTPEPTTTNPSDTVPPNQPDYISSRNYPEQEPIDYAIIFLIVLSILALLACCIDVAQDCKRCQDEKDQRTSSGIRLPGTSVAAIAPVNHDAEAINSSRDHSDDSTPASPRSEETA
jgi:hypothetical protein